MAQIPSNASVDMFWTPGRCCALTEICSTATASTSVWRRGWVSDWSFVDHCYHSHIVTQKLDILAHPVGARKKTMLVLGHLTWNLRLEWMAPQPHVPEVSDTTISGLMDGSKTYTPFQMVGNVCHQHRSTLAIAVQLMRGGCSIS